MIRQRRQLLIVTLVLILAVLALVFVWRLPKEEETANIQSYPVTDMDQDKINHFSFTNESGMCNFTRQDGAWVNEEDRSLDVDADAIERLVGKVASLTSQNRIEQVEDSAQYGLDEPAATILIADGTTGYTLLVGDRNDLTGTYYICMESDPGTVYTADSYIVSDFIEMDISDLIVTPEETGTAST